jgi:hypothetical protein
MLLVARSTTLVFNTWSTAIQKFRVFILKVGTSETQGARAPRAARCRSRAAGSEVRSCTSPGQTPPEALPVPRSRAPMHPARGAPMSAPPYARARRGPPVRRRCRRHTRVAQAAVVRRVSSPSPPHHPRRTEPLIKPPRHPPRASPSRPPPLLPPPSAGARRPCSPPSSRPVSFPSP